MKRVKHDNDLAVTTATAAGMKSVKYLKREAVRLARELGIDLPSEGA